MAPPIITLEFAPQTGEQLGRCIWEDEKGHCIYPADAYDGLCNTHRWKRTAHRHSNRLFQEADNLVCAHRGLQPKELVKTVVPLLRRAVNKQNIAPIWRPLWRNDAKSVLILVLAAKRHPGRLLTWEDFKAVKSEYEVRMPLKTLLLGLKWSFEEFEPDANRYFERS